MGKGRGAQVFYKIESYFPLPYSTGTVSTTVEGCQAGGLSHLLQYMRELSMVPLNV